MAKPIGLVQRGQSRQLRICIPKDLWDAYGGRKDIRISLGKLNPTEAKIEAHRIRVEKDAEFLAKRRELGLAPLEVAHVTPELASAIAQGVYALSLEQDDQARASKEVFEALEQVAKKTDLAYGLMIQRDPGVTQWSPVTGLTEGAAKALAGLHATAEGQAAMSLARRNLLVIQPIADVVARRMGLSVDWSTPGGLDALRQSLEAYRRAWRDRTRRDIGEVVVTPEVPSAPTMAEAKPQPTTHRLEEVFNKWKSSGDNPSDATIRKKLVAVRLYEEFTADTPIESLTPEKGGEFAGWLLTKCKAEKTAKDHLDGVKSLLNKATKAGGLGWLVENPWAGHRVKVRKQNTRKPWTSENLVKLFDSRLFRNYELPSTRSAGGAAAYWVPLLGIYTGARQSELCQLRVADIEEMSDGFALHVTCEDAADEDGLTETSTKTKESVRRIPVPQALVDLGLIDYVNDIKQAGHALLFPDVVRAPGRPAGEYFSDWFLIYRREQGIDARWVDFHAFRHTASTRLIDAGVSDSVADYLSGHASDKRGSARRYKHMQDLRAQQAKLAYPELKLRRVYPCRHDAAGS